MRGVLTFLATLIVVAVLGWIGLWWYAQGRMQNEFESWAEQQSTHGVTVAYSSIQRGSSPTEALVSITNLTFTFPVTASGATPVVTLPSLALRIDLPSITKLHVDLPNKMTINGGGNIDLAMNAGSISLTENLDPNALFNKSVYPFKGGDFDASNVDFLASSGSLLVLHLDSLISHADINLNAGAGDPALNETITVNGMALSPLMTRIASIPFDGKISQFGLTIDLTGPVPPGIYTLPEQIRAVQNDQAAQQKLMIPIIHQWASGGGSGNLLLTLAIGPSTANSSAAIKFDANLQPEGTASLTADHLDEFTSAITAAYPQIAGTISGAEAQLTPYISTTPASGQTLTINATYGAGAININGAKVAPMPPVDWNSLENPAAGQ